MPQVRGAKGESLYPLQQDGMIKTTAFRWKFYTAEESKYEHQVIVSLFLSLSVAPAQKWRHHSLV